MFVEGEYKDSRGRKQKIVLHESRWLFFHCIWIHWEKADSFKLKYIEAFNRMEKEIQQPKLPTSKRELALLALSANEETNERVDVIEKEVADLKTIKNRCG